MRFILPNNKTPVFWTVKESERVSQKSFFKVSITQVFSSYSGTKDSKMLSYIKFCPTALKISCVALPYAFITTLASGRVIVGISALSSTLKRIKLSPRCFLPRILTDLASLYASSDVLYTLPRL